MRRFWFLIYDFLAIPILYLSLSAAALLNKKVARGKKGRTKLFEELQAKLEKLDRTKPLIWVHSASLGEFEQAKPVIEELKSARDISILVTFFSPSGYDNAKNYPNAEIISYIPFDFSSHASRFVELCKPDIAVFMRYDLWPNHIYHLNKRNIPVFLLTATLRSDSTRKKPLLKSFHKMLFSMLSGIMAISEEDKNNFIDVLGGSEKVTRAGDTRFDRVYQKSLEARERKLINQEIFAGKKVFVAGSSWDEDEEILFPALMKLNKYIGNILFIIVPHEPTVAHIERVEQEFGKNGLNVIRFSFLNNYKGEQVIIVDSIGILLSLYSYADAAFVGGSFKSNIHNVLEAAVYGIPVVYGPKIHGSQEAGDLAKSGGGTIFRTKQECYRKLRKLFTDHAERLLEGQLSKDFVRNNTGATDLICGQLSRFLD